MKKRRVPYNEISEEIYEPKYWTKAKLISLGIFILFFGFLINFSLEEKINKYLQKTLASNSSCPVQFEKAELSYLLPKIVLRSPVVLGACFGQYNNRLEFKDITLSFHSPSFYPVGLRFHIEAFSGKSYMNLYPVVSLFSQNVKIEKTLIDSQIFSAMTSNNISPISGALSIEGFFEFKSGVINDGEIDIVSKNFTLPSQNIKGFEMTRLSLETLQISAHFESPEKIIVDRIQLGKPNGPLELMLKGNISVTESQFSNSKLTLNGNLKLSNYILQTFAFLKLFLPETNTSGNYQLKINGTLANPGTPTIL